MGLDLGSYICVGIPAAALISCFGFLFASGKGEKKREEMFWRDMEKLHEQLIDDPSMTSEKWRSWLPLFEYADDCFRKVHPFATGFTGLAERVKEDIDDLPYRHRIGSPD